MPNRRKGKVRCGVERGGGGGGGGGGGAGRARRCREFNSRFSELLLQASVSNLCFIARLSARALV